MTANRNDNVNPIIKIILIISALILPNFKLLAQQNTEATTIEFSTTPYLIETIADSASLQEDKALFKGNVEFNYQQIQLFADEAIYENLTQRILLTGNIKIINQLTTISGEKASLNLLANISKVKQAYYEIERDKAQHTFIRGSAEEIVLLKDQSTTIKQGSYTQCKPENKIWEVEAKEISLDQNKGQGYAKHAVLKIKNTPILYTPYAQFPIGDKRQSGFLFPKLSDTSNGFDVSVPYYLNVASNIDATLSPRYKVNTGYITEAEIRWLNHFDNWTLSGGYIDKDESENDKSRWIINLKEEGNLQDKFFSRIDFTEISDIDYLRDIDTANLNLNRQNLLNQSAEFSFKSYELNAGINIQKYQSLDNSETENNTIDTTIEILPEAYIHYQKQDKPFSILPSLEIRYGEFEKNNDTIQRSNVALNITYPMQLSGLSIKPHIGTVYLEHRSDNNSNLTVNNESITANQAGIDSSIQFQKTIRDSKGLKTHILEPRLAFFHRETNRTQKNRFLLDSDWTTLSTDRLYTTDRFSGYDILEETSQITASLKHSHVDYDGLEKLSLTLGQIFYLDSLSQERDSLLNLGDRGSKESALFSSFSSQFNTSWKTLSSISWDTDNNKILQGDFVLRYRQNGKTFSHNPQQTLFNLRYNYLADDLSTSTLKNNIEQTDLSIVRYLNSQWGLFGRSQYDISNDRFNEQLAGIEYNNCCIQLRLVYRDALIYTSDDTEDSLDRESRDKGFFLQIELKGLAGVGRTVESMLENTIFGFKQNSH